jgi:Fic family protein
MFEYTITDRMNTDLRQLDALRDQLDLRGSLPRRWMGRLRRELQASSIAASTSMEGVRVTVEDVRRLMVGDVPSAVTPDDAALVQGYREAMEYVLKRADAPAFAWSPELLLALQDSVLAHSFARGAGKFRQTAVRVVDGGGVTRYEAPSSEAVPGLVDELVAWANAAAGVPTPVVSAMIHVGIAAIHPFSDGNGRTARVCAALAMLRGGYRAAEFTSLEEWWGSHLSAYYASFECLGRAWKSDSDVTPFLETHVAAQCAQAATLALRQRVERQLWQMLEDIVGEDLHGPARWADALFDAFMQRAVTNRYYRGVADIEIAAASQDLAKLRTAGVLIARGAGASRAYLGAPRLYRLVAERMGMEGEIEREVDGDLVRDQLLGALTARVHAGDEFIAREVAARYSAK